MQVIQSPLGRVLLVAAVSGLFAACESTNTGSSSTPKSPTTTDTTRTKTDANLGGNRGTGRESSGSSQDAGGSAGFVAMAFPTGDKSTSAVLLERSMPKEIVANANFSYDMKVTNLTRMQLREVVVRDQCANNFTLVSSEPAASGNPLVWQLGDLPAGGSKTIKVTGKAAGSGSVTNCATVSYNSLLCASAAIVEPALKVAMSGPAEGTPCEALTYKYVVTNAGTGVARDVKVSVALPAGWSTESKTGTIDVGTLAAGQSKDVTVVAKSGKTGKFDLGANAVAGGSLTATSNAVSTTIKQAALTVKAECPDRMLPGRDVTNKFTVKSGGELQATKVTVVATLPAGAGNAKADNGGTVSGNKVTWNLGALPVNDTRALSVTYRPTGAGELVVSATAQADCVAQVSDSCKYSIQGVPDIGTGIGDEGGVRVVGETHTFRYNVKNQGQVNLTNVVLVATLTEGIEYVSTTATNPPTVSDAKLTYQIGSLKPNEERVFDIVCRGTTAGERGIDTTTSCNELKRVVRNDEQVTYVDK